MRILPAVLKELSKHVPSVLFQTVDWNELVSELPKISRRMLQKEGYDDLYQAHKELLDPYNIVLTADSLTRRTVRKDQWSGEKWLTLYFAQLFSPYGLFLDLRSIHFEDDEEKLKWHPTGLWIKFEDKFKEGLLKVYEGFYLENESIYYEGLEEIGLLKSEFSQEEKKELGNLFRAHFGSDQQEMKFDLEQFKYSMIKMSEFMINKRVKISKDFLYLGIYLVTMYSSLEETRAMFPVKKIYQDVRSRFNSAENR